MEFTLSAAEGLAVKIARLPYSWLRANGILTALGELAEGPISRSLNYCLLEHTHQASELAFSTREQRQRVPRCCFSDRRK